MADVKISALTTQTAPVRAADYAPIYDAAAGSTKKVLLSNFGVYDIVAAVGNCSPADSTTYYFGAFPDSALSTSAFGRYLLINRSGIINRVAIRTFVSGTPATAETSSLYVRYNDTTDTTLTTTLAFNANVLTAYTSLGIAVTAGGALAIKWVTPAWATNPTGVYIHLQLLVE